MAKDEYEENSFYKSNKRNVLVISIIISAILMFSVFVFIKFTFLYILSEKEINLETQETNTELSVVISDSEIALKDTVNKFHPNDRIYKVFFIGLLIYSILAVAVISLLVYLAVCDDGGIRFAKLNELRNLRKLYFDKFSNDFQEYEEINTNNFEKSNTTIKVDASNKSGKSDVLVNLNAPNSESHKKKNVKEELIKNYMNAILEI